jgi:DNA polymerase
MKQEIHSKMMETDKYETFASYFSQGCSHCTLSTHDNRPVVFRGNPKAPIVLIGEAPGAKEDQDGKPFMGPAGQLLDRIFHSIGINTNTDMLLTNTVYCRPVAAKFSGRQNYTPRKEQTARCWPFTKRALEILSPKIIIACGRTALHSLFGDNTAKVSEWEGRWSWYTGGERHWSKFIPIFTMVHPAAILHQSYDPEKQNETRAKVWKYMQYFRDTYKEKIK